MALSYNLGYQESISLHPTRRQNFAGKPYSNFPNIWEWLLYFHFYFLQELKTKKRKNDQCVWFHLFCQTGDKRGVLYSWAIVQGGFHRNTCKWHVIKNKKQFWFELFTGRFSSWLNITVSIDNNCSKDTRLKIWVLFRRIILSSYIQQNTLNEKRTMSHMNYETIYLGCFVWITKQFIWNVLLR